ncbi:phosphoribosyl pyrophosphate synthase-associated protein 2 isoform X2 [Arapaima gigas]
MCDSDQDSGNIQDDIIDDVVSFVTATETLKERGACKVVKQVDVTNIIAHEIQKLRSFKIKTVGISMVVSKAIRCILNAESMSTLLRNIVVDN